jgi:hypothetical protein
MAVVLIAVFARLLREPRGVLERLAARAITDLASAGA